MNRFHKFMLKPSRWGHCSSEVKSYNLMLQLVFKWWTGLKPFRTRSTWTRRRRKIRTKNLIIHQNHPSVLGNLTKRRVKTRNETFTYQYSSSALANLTRRRVKIRTEILIHYPPSMLSNLTRRRVKIRTETLIHHYPPCMLANATSHLHWWSLRGYGRL